MNYIRVRGFGDGMMLVNLDLVKFFYERREDTTRLYYSLGEYIEVKVPMRKFEEAIQGIGHEIYLLED